VRGGRLQPTPEAKLFYVEAARVLEAAENASRVVAETEFFSTACQFVAEGRGVGIVDPVVSKPFTEGLAIRPFKPRIQYEVAILSPTHETPSQVAQHFVKVLRRALRA